jgi:ligand-binding sensor domain-containing protein/two-component sensor histidine kinase
LLLVIFACYVPATFASIPSTHYSFKLWQTQDGLPENTVQAFAQTKDGFLWIGTSGGLARFDGDGFDVFDHTNTPAFVESSVLCLLVSSEGDLWIGSDGGGLVRYHNGRFERVGTQSGLEHAFVRALFQDSHGVIWVGTDGGLFQLNAGSRFDAEPVHGMASMSVQAMEEDSEGRIWIGGDRLFFMSGGEFREEKLSWLGENQITSLRKAANGEIWLGTLEGLWRYAPREHHFVRIQGIRGTVRSLAVGVDSTLWVGTAGGGAFSVRGIEVRHLTTPASVVSNSVFSVFQDGNSSLWLGTQAGMLRVTTSAITIIHLPEISASEYGTVYLDLHGTLWVASHHLYKVRNDRGVRVSLPALHGASVRNVLMGEDKTMWFGTNGDGVYHLLPDKTLHYTVDNGLANNFIRVLIQARDGSIWMGTDVGLSHLKAGHFQNFGLKDGLCHLDIHSIVEDSTGDLWIGTSLGLSHLHNGRFVEDAATRGLRAEKVWSISITRDGAMLFGTRHGGLYEFARDQIEHFTMAQGLSSDSIYKILGDGKDNLWLSGPDGISRINIDDLEVQARGGLKEISLRTYYISDEGNTVQFYGGTQPAGAIGREGEVWFPSNRGIVHIALDKRTIAPPKLRLKRIAADGKDLPVDNPIHLSADNSTLEVDYAPISLRPQVGMHYRYKLDGFDKAWNSALKRKTAYYTNLPAGHYTFRVEGYETDRPNVFSETSLAVDKKQYFYRTWWFILFAIVCASVGVWSIHLMKVRRVNAQFLATLEERGRLAREIHDTVLQGCASVSSLLEASSSAESEPELRRKLVDYARSQIGTTMDEARRAVWNLRQASELPRAIRGSIEEMAQRTSGEFGIPVSCVFQGAPSMIDGPVCHEIVMVIREALCNALVHSQARSIEISTTSSPGNLTVSVLDNGSGFDIEQASDEAHYGLVGMKERIRRLGGSIDIESQLGKGTEVVFTVSMSKIKASREVSA